MRTGKLWIERKRGGGLRLPIPAVTESIVLNPRIAVHSGFVGGSASGYSKTRFRGLEANCLAPCQARHRYNSAVRIPTKIYTIADSERFRALGDVTENGVTFDSWLVGSNGMSFCLLQQPQHSHGDIDMAKRYLKRDRDVVRITVAKVAGSST